jgi:hypothetical protein
MRTLAFTLKKGPDQNLLVDRALCAVKRTDRRNQREVRALNMKFKQHVLSQDALYVR